MSINKRAVKWDLEGKGWLIRKVGAFNIGVLMKMRTELTRASPHFAAHCNYVWHLSFSKSCIQFHDGKLWCSVVKNLSAMQETQVQPLSWEDPLQKGIPCSGWEEHPSIPAWEIPMTEEPEEL